MRKYKDGNYVFYSLPNHKVKIEKDAKSLFPSEVFFVNSFHENVVLKRDISSQFLPLMYAEDESVEAFVHKKYPILGVMFQSSQKRMKKITCQDV